MGNSKMVKLEIMYYIQVCNYNVKRLFSAEHFHCFRLDKYPVHHDCTGSGDSSTQKLYFMKISEFTIESRLTCKILSF